MSLSDDDWDLNDFDATTKPKHQKSPPKDEFMDWLADDGD